MDFPNEMKSPTSLLKVTFPCCEVRTNFNSPISKFFRSIHADLSAYLKTNKGAPCDWYISISWLSFRRTHLLPFFFSKHKWITQSRNEWRSYCSSRWPFHSFWSSQSKFGALLWPPTLDVVIVQWPRLCFCHADSVLFVSPTFLHSPQLNVLTLAENCWKLCTIGRQRFAHVWDDKKVYRKLSKAVELRTQTSSEGWSQPFVKLANVDWMRRSKGSALRKFDFSFRCERRKAFLNFDMAGNRNGKR